MHPQTVRSNPFFAFGIPFPFAPPAVAGRRPGSSSHEKKSERGKEQGSEGACPVSDWVRNASSGSKPATGPIRGCDGPPSQQTTEGKETAREHKPPPEKSGPLPQQHTPFALCPCPSPAIFTFFLAFYLIHSKEIPPHGPCVLGRSRTETSLQSLYVVKSKYTSHGLHRQYIRTTQLPAATPWLRMELCDKLLGAIHLWPSLT